MTIVGLSAYYHDSAAAIVRGGEIIAAAQEERFTRVKHDPAFPRHALDYCLKEADIAPADIDYVAFYEKPLLKFDRLIESYLATAPKGFKSFVAALPSWIREKLALPRDLASGLGEDFKGRFVFPSHHESHAASAFFPSPFEEAAVLTLDGVGEWACASWGTGRGNRLDLVAEQHFPHSLGLLYSAFTQYLGFQVNSGEYKVMGLAPYGKPRFKDKIFEEIVSLGDDGSVTLTLERFGFITGTAMISPCFADVFGQPPRIPEGKIEAFHCDVAASIQAVIEESVLSSARYIHRETGLSRLTMAGGVALNCVANGKILKETPFEDLWVQPASGDAGGALGAALFVWHQLLDQARPEPPEGRCDHQSGSALGPSFGREAIRAAIAAEGGTAEEFDGDEALCERCAKTLSSGNVLGWFQGRAEFGPRALGARSILADPRSPEMQKNLNLKIKFRESFRPFAPAVPAGKLLEYFEPVAAHPARYMLATTHLREDRRVSPPGQKSGTDQLGDIFSDLPAVTHVDHSARAQVVDPETSPLFHQLFNAFESETGCAVLANTSMNVRGEPIVGSPNDAIRCFFATGMDALAIGPFFLEKSVQDPGRVAAVADEYKNQFGND